VPTGRVEVAIVTVPLGVTVPAPNVVVPLVTVTVPVVPAGSVVVIVTGEPNVLGPDVVTVTGGVDLLTVCVVAPLEGLLFESPP
jgi:hypothetical protein